MKRLITHHGKFHADDVFSTAWLKIIYGNLDVKRIDRSDIYKYINDKENFIYDIGNGKYDHHTKECKEYRNNGSPYASFGKIVRDTYKLVGFDYNTYKTFDYFFITPIDTVDNEGPNSVISQDSDVIRATNLSFDFAIMDILEENPDGINWFSLTSDSNSTKHDNHLENYVNKGIDKKSVKPKLEKLANTGIIEFFENGKKIRKVNTRQIKQLLSSTEVKQAIQFASETSPLGVIGSYVLDNLKTVDSESLNTPIHYKHHFIFNSIDYEIMYILMDAITNKNTVEIETERYGIKTVVPLKLYISTQTGRIYIIFWDLHESILFSENLEKDPIYDYFGFSKNKKTIVSLTLLRIDAPFTPIIATKIINRIHTKSILILHLNQILSVT